jgi:hypothetical protein
MEGAAAGYGGVWFVCLACLFLGRLFLLFFWVVFAGWLLPMLLVLPGRLPWSICIKIGLDRSLVRN